jgi:3-methyladenine DNA glycosylase AlkD
VPKSTSLKGINQALEKIRTFCITRSDEKNKDRYKRFFTEGYDPYGISKEIWEAEKDGVIASYKDDLGLSGCLDLGQELIKNGKYEEASFALHSIMPFKDEYTLNTFQRVGTWLEYGICNWAHSDILCDNILAHFLTENIVNHEAMATWRTAPVKWKRRAVPVALRACLKRCKDCRPLVEFLRPLMLDPERVVQQGLGWFLRDAWKQDPGIVEAFLKEYKDTAPRLIFQYTTEKMPKTKKDAFRKTKSKPNRSSRL